MNKKIWACKIGEVDASKLPPGADLPMRQAIKEAYFRITGEYPQFLFSGWGAELDDIERGIISADLEIAYTGEEKS